MSQLIIFSLLAGTIGISIGWIARGNCKKIIQESNKIWDEKLHKNNTKYEYKIKKVKSNYAKHISKLNQKLLFMHNVLNKKESYQEELKQAYINELTVQAKQWENKKERLIRNNDNNLIHLNSELSSLRKKLQYLKKSENRVLNTNIEYAYQLKTLAKKHFDYINQSKKEHLKLKNRVVITENTIKKLNDKLAK